MSHRMQAADAPQGTPAKNTHPTKHMVRAWLTRRLHELKPPPAPEEIRRQLGWGMLMIEPCVPPRAR